MEEKNSIVLIEKKKEEVNTVTQKSIAEKMRVIISVFSFEENIKP